MPRQPLLGNSARARYNAICKLNIIENVAKVTLAFYERLGLNPRHSPAGKCLANLRTQLAEEVEAYGAISAGSSLERFELAWCAYEAGATQNALQLFRKVVDDAQLIAASAADPGAREAFVRTAEILGHHAEMRGDTGVAAELYRRIIDFDDTGIVARRLFLMLWRDARIREAAELAPRIMQSDGNLAQHWRGSDAVADLTRRLREEARSVPTTARGPHARDLDYRSGEQLGPRRSQIGVHSDDREDATRF